MPIRSQPLSLLSEWLSGRFVPFLLAVVLAFGSAGALLAEDTDLLTRNSADPFLFILLDNSRSMAATIDNEWTHAGADDPRSRLYIAKEILYEELLNVNDVHYGLATFNQDELRVRSKHYLYYVADTTANRNELANLPEGLDSGQGNNAVPYPTPQTTSITPSTDGTDGSVTLSIDGDLLTLGRTFPRTTSSTNLLKQTVRAGTCDAPLDLDSEREKVNRYPIFGEDGDMTVEVWVEASNKTFRLQWRRPALGDGTLADWALGDTPIQVELGIAKVTDCSGSDVANSTLADDVTLSLELELWKPFLWVDDANGSSFNPGNASCGASDSTEMAGGFWALDPRDVDSVEICADKPFSGQGWEGNYDTGKPFTTNASFENSLSDGDSVFDTFCDGSGTSENHCRNILRTTTYATDPNAREIDSGDFLPFTWQADNHQEMLKRLNPRHPLGTDFGVANYFADAASNPDGALPLVDSTEIPILAAGDSPIGSAALDFRCWFVGENDSNKCKRKETDTSDTGSDNESFTPVYTTGFMNLLKEQDRALSICRRPFMIIITDLHGNCTANSSVANAAGMFGETSDTDGLLSNNAENGVSTWVLNMGRGKCNGLTNAGKGEAIDATSKEKLRTELRKILGEIEESTRSFAAAAVPSVQADVEDKIYFTQFVPLQDNGIWPGEVLAFRKPLPTKTQLDGDDANCDPATNDDCRLVPDPDHAIWDAGEAMLAQSPDFGSLDTVDYPSQSDLQIGSQSTQRRVIYAVDDPSVPRLRTIFGPPESSVDGYSEFELLEDLSQGLKIQDRVDLGTFSSEADILADGDAKLEYDEIFDVLKATLVEKQWTDDDGIIHDYILGDIFHSNPQLLSSPSNPFFLSDPVSFPLYEEFSQRHQKRRKMLVVGANDGLLHIFDAGRFDTAEDEFNNGSGREILGYVPRSVMPKLRAYASDPVTHQWYVDGTPQIADVFIDVDGETNDFDTNDDGTVDFQDKREWRTVVVGGLRRGGPTIYALDVTTPDPVKEESVTIGGFTVTGGFEPTQSEVVPSCFADADPLPAGPFPNDNNCDPVPFGTILWEFTDGSSEDGLGGDDLANTWSAPDIGPIRVKLAGETVLRWVAIFGGGYEGLGTTGQGNWIYMVDMETGEAIYKRQVGTAGLAAAPRAVDVNQDGVLDRIYQASTDGRLYRVDMSTPPTLVLDDPTTCTMAVSDSCLVDADVDGNSVPDWDPVVFFDTLTQETDADGNTVDVRRPIFYAPSVLFVGQFSGFAVAFGTGNRDNIWSTAPLGGNRFYVISDEICDLVGAGSFCVARTALPFDETALVDVTGTDTGNNNTLTDLDARDSGHFGWFIQLGVEELSDEETVDTETDDILLGKEDELLVTPPVTVSGLTVFSTFIPQTGINVGEVDDDDGNSGGGGGGDKTVTCARRGISRNYVTLTTSGDAVFDEGRFKVSKSLVSEPFLEPSQTQNDPDSGVSSPDPCEGSETLFEKLKGQLFPDSCKFSPNFRFNLMTNLSDTGLECIVQIPVCIQQRNWKEF